MGWFNHQPLYHSKIHDYKGLYPTLHIIGPVSLRPFRGGPGPPLSNPEAKTAANVDMAFLTAAQNLVEMRRAPRRSRQIGRMDETGLGAHVFFSLGIVVINGMKVKHGR